MKSDDIKIDLSVHVYNVHMKKISILQCIKYIYGYIDISHRL